MDTKSQGDAVLTLLKKRDLANFTRLRSAIPGDDVAIGDLLVNSFLDTYAKKLPDIPTDEARQRELRDIESRRQNGIVRVLEFGYRIIGCYSLIHPTSALNESWSPQTCTLRCLAMHPEFHSLRLSEKLLSDAITIARGWHARHICLHVQVGADGVGRLYENFGFTRSPLGDKICNGQPIQGYLYTLDSSLVEQMSLA